MAPAQVVPFGTLMAVRHTGHDPSSHDRLGRPDGGAHRSAPWRAYRWTYEGDPVPTRGGTASCSGACPGCPGCPAGRSVAGRRGARRLPDARRRTGVGKRGEGRGTGARVGQSAGAPGDEGGVPQGPRPWEVSRPPGVGAAALPAVPGATGAAVPGMLAPPECGEQGRDLLFSGTRTCQVPPGRAGPAPDRPGRGQCRGAGPAGARGEGCAAGARRPVSGPASRPGRCASPRRVRGGGPRRGCRTGSARGGTARGRRRGCARPGCRKQAACPAR